MSNAIQQPSTGKKFSVHQYGKVFGAILLISGSCIGVGTLAAPILSGMAGPKPTCVVIFLCWLYMMGASLLLTEALQNESYNSNIVSLSSSAFGQVGKWTAWMSFMSLFFSLVTAYIAKGGELTQSLLESSLAVDSLPSWVGPLVITIISTGFVFSGTRAVDLFNRICMYFLFSAYFYFLFSGLEVADVKNLQYTDWSYTLFIIPFFITSFGFHNMIPTINEYLEGNRKHLIFTILISGLLICFIYIFWTISMHSMIPLHGDVSIMSSFRNGEIVTQPIVQLVQNPLMQLVAVSFAFFVIITSLLGQSLSLLDFITDALHMTKSTRERLILCFIIFSSACILSQTVPGIFFLSLEFAGGIATMILFGIIPSLLAWKKRYGSNVAKVDTIMPGGKLMLVAMISISCFVILYELLKHFY